MNEIREQTDKELAILQSGHAYLLLPPIFFRVERKMLKEILDMMKLFDCDVVYSEPGNTVKVPQMIGGIYEEQKHSNRKEEQKQ